MGEATRAQFTNGCVTWKKAKDNTVLDVTTMLKEKPYLLVRYPLLKEGSRRFLIA